MLKHYITYYPNTDKLKTFRQTWKGKDELYEEYYINGNISLTKWWEDEEYFILIFDETGREVYFEDSNGYSKKMIR